MNQGQLVRDRITGLAFQASKTLYRLKHGLLDDYFFQQLKHPAPKMKLA